jgi:hypothetical protein
MPRRWKRSVSLLGRSNVGSTSGRSARSVMLVGSVWAALRRGRLRVQSTGWFTRHGLHV